MYIRITIERVNLYVLTLAYTDIIISVPNGVTGDFYSFIPSHICHYTSRSSRFISLC